MTIVKCPTCAKDVPWNNNSPFRPFCSERCKLIDLGEWASESHVIPGKTEQVPVDEFDEFDLPANDDFFRE